MSTTFESTIVDIATRLRDGQFRSEQAVSQGIVLRLLQELRWDTWDTARVWPEYRTGEGRVDFALCHPASRPAIFIEVKQLGKAEDAVRQALEYAFHTGVPFVVLTDGRTWGFYLPAEQGSYDDRRVYKLDLFERQPSEAITALEKYLARSRVESGQALETARHEYRDRNRRAQSRNALPNAWRELVEKDNEELVEILASAVESTIGVRPEDNDVAQFLTELGRTVVTPSPPRPLQTGPQNERAAEMSQPLARWGELRLLGTTHRYSNAKDAMVKVLTELANRDSSFLERCAQHPDMQGRKRQYVARNPDDLYPGRPDLCEFRESLPGGWYVGTNLNNVLKRTIIKTATEVAGLRFGHDVVVEFDR